MVSRFDLYAIAGINSTELVKEFTTEDDRWTSDTCLVLNLKLSIFKKYLHACCYPLDQINMHFCGNVAFKLHSIILICFIYRNFPLLQANIKPWKKLKSTIQKCSSTRCRENLGVNYFTSNPTSQISKGLWDLTNMATHWTRLRSNPISRKVYLEWFNTWLNEIV